MSASDTTTPEKAARTDVQPFTSYSLNFEDVILNRLFPAKAHGFYVDVGAGHPRFENDLYAFYQRGWTGINVEPNEGFFRLQQELRPRDRNLCMVLSDTAGEPLAYYEVEGSGLSTCDEAQAKELAAQGHSLRRRVVPVGTLAGILSEAGARHIDILKVDVEGFEEKVLSSNDWERFRPSVVLVEATYPESRERRPTNIRGFMEQRGYRHAHFDGLNDFYLEHGFTEPDDFTLPPNVFDDYVPREIADLREQVTSLQDQVENLRHQVVSLQTEFASASDYAHSLEASAAELQANHEALQSSHGEAQNSREMLQASHDEALKALAETQASYQDALRAAGSLATENRRLGNQAAGLTSESGRYRKAADQLRGELTALGRFLEPMHSVHEQLERMRRDHVEELHLLRAEMDRRHDAIQAAHQGAAAELRAMRQAADAERRLIEARLQAVYLSTSWFLTKPWRVTGRLVKRLVR